MHPIERLRYVARSSGVPQSSLVREAAGALLSFSGDPDGLVTACRRMVARQPASGPLLWVASRVLMAPNPAKEAYESIDLLEEDRTPRELRHILPDGAVISVIGWPDNISQALPARGDLEVRVIDALGEGSGFVQRLWNSDIDAVDVPFAGLGAAVAGSEVLVLESPAVGGDEFLAISGTRAAAAVAKHAGVPVWLVAGVGRLLPQPLWLSLRDRVAPEEPWDADEEFVPLDLVDFVVDQHGCHSVTDALQKIDCPVANELLRKAI